MGSLRKWSFRTQLAINCGSALLNGVMAGVNWRSGNYRSMQLSIGIVVLVSVVFWCVVWTEEKVRVAHLTRESYLKEQDADTRLKEEILEHFRQMKASNPEFSFGLPIDMRSKH